jgi:dTDP-4-amino-4,6-dideoxygalactose transaminase
VIRHEQADALADHLRTAGVECRAYYRVPAHAQPALALDLDLPGTALAARTHLAIPISAAITAEQVAQVAAAIRDARLG